FLFFSGFYRVNYDDKNWQLIIKYINSDNYDRIHHLNRAQLIDDTFLLAEIGNVDYRITFNLLKYLEYETHYIPWNSFWKQLSRFHKSALPSSKFYDVFKVYRNKLIYQVKRIFMDDESNDDRYLKSLRKKFIHWTCQFGSNLCKNYTFSKLTKWLEDPKKNSLPNNFKKEILCGGMRKADQKTWNQLWDKFYHHISDQESLNALGCSLDDNILKNFIAKAVEDRFRSIYPWTLFEVIGGQSYRGIDVILETMNSNQTEYNEK
ncbi:GSCOCG00004247001-RA-CDS, partial [Cotesia congregata]